WPTSRRRPGCARRTSAAAPAPTSGGSPRTGCAWSPSTAPRACSWRPARRRPGTSWPPTRSARTPRRCPCVRDAGCDRVLAAHMRFHVPDRVAALRELRRVVRPGGRVVLVTNGPAGERLWAAHARAARAAGYTPTAPPWTHVSLDHLALVR